jgi:Transposase IS116/IS110/IS902 family
MFGIGLLTASAATATVGDARQFRNGRQFAAWLGLVPKQNSSGGKDRLGRVTKQGNEYLRTLWFQCARVTVTAARRRKDRLSRWIAALSERVGHGKALVAVANKHARVLWAILAKASDSTRTMSTCDVPKRRTSAIRNSLGVNFLAASSADARKDKRQVRPAAGELAG